MHVNNEQTNTQKMLQHNQAKERVFSGGSLQRKLTDLINLESGKFNIDFRESTILNSVEYSQDQLRNLLSCPSRVVSDADAQLLIKLKFIDKIDCNQLVFDPPSCGSDGTDNISDEISNARLVRVFVNRPEMDFSDLGDGGENGISPATSFELPFEFAEPFVANLVGTKFTRVSSLQIFIEDNFGTDKSQIGKLSIRGFLTPNYHVEYK